MQEGQFLWVNKTPSSTSLSNSHADGKARHTIYSHVQLHSKLAERRLKADALPEDSASKPLSGWIRRSQLREKWSSASPRSSSPTDKETEPGQDSLPVKRRSLRPLLPQVFRMNHALDPFECMAVKVDSNAYDLLQFYLGYTKLAPMAWDSEPYGPSRSHREPDEVSVVRKSMSNNLHFYTFLSLIAAIMETLGIGDYAGRGGPLYSQRALEEMQKQFRNDPVDEGELLYGISRMAIAAVLQGDEFGAQAHLRAAKYFVDKGGGFGAAVTPSIARRIKYADLHLAVETLSAPIFPLDFDPTGIPNKNHESDPQLEQLGQNALQLSRIHLAPCLHEIVERTIQCAGIVESVWAQSNSTEARIDWLVSKPIATLTRLLSMNFQSESNLPKRKTHEAAKMTVILWNLVLIFFIKGMVGDASVRDTMIKFNETKCEAMRDFWPPCVYLGLIKWNAVVQSSSFDVGAERRRPFLRLINVVRSMEVESLVRLGSLINRLYQLEGTYQTQKRQRQELTITDH